jgi:hypothetical protein
MKELELLVCPQTTRPCRHCSMERTTRPFTKITKNKTSGLYDPAGLGKTVIELGSFCNNDGNKYVSELEDCPALYKPEVRSVKVKAQPVWKIHMHKNKPQQSLF